MNNLRNLYLTSATYSIYDSLTFVFIVPFALALGASNTYIGIISAITYLAALLSELPGAQLIDYFNRRSIVMWTTLIARLGWLLMAFVPFIFKENPLLWIFILYCYIRIIELLHEPAWIEILADIIPTNKRGEILARRNVIIGWSGLIASLIAGWYLDLFQKNDYFGFSSLFAISIIFALIQFYATSEIQEPRRQHKHHGFKDALHLPTTLRTFTILSTFFNFAVMIASPFFAVYMLKNLNMSYTSYVIATGLMALSKILLQQRLGNLTDKVGDVPVMILSSIGITLVPFFFIFITPDTWWLVLPVHLISGIAWAGVDIAKLNLLLDYTDKEKRAVQTATYNMISAIPNTLGPILGGYIADNISLGTLAGIPLVFAIAAALRLITGILFNNLPEVRAKNHYPLVFIAKHMLFPHTHESNTIMKGVLKHK